MSDSTRHHEALSRSQLDDPARRNTVLCGLEVDQEMALEHEEKFIIRGMLMPMIFTLHDAEADYRLIHPSERLVVPCIVDHSNERIDQDFLQCAI